MSDTDKSARAAELAARHDEDVAAHKAAIEAQAVEEVEFQDVGYAETQSHQTEVVAGTPEHERELKTFPNASSYGPHVNVVVAPIPEPEEPPVLEPEVDQDAPAQQPSRY